MPAPGHDDPASVPLDGLHIIHLPPQQQTLPHTSADSSPDSPTGTSASTCSSRSSLSRRRSVSSMKGLMPLTLSASTASYASPILQEDNLKQRVDDYLPELLAQDLEFASDLFAAKRMSAGAPTYSVVADYMARAKATGQFTNRLSMALPYQPASARVQVLGAIEERDSIASFLEQQEQQQHQQHHHHHHDGYPDASDLDDLSSEDGSVGMPPPSFRYRRNMSIITTATSFTDSVQKQSPQPSPLHMEPVRGSWIDGDSDTDSDSNSDFEIDDEDSYVGPEPLPILLPRSYVPPQEPLLPLFPRSPTSPTTPDDALYPLDYEQPAGQDHSRMLHKKSHSVAGVPSAASLTPEKNTASKQAAADTPYTTPSNHTSIIAQEFQRATSPDSLAAEQRAPGSHVLASTPPPVPQKHHQRISRLSAESLRKQKQSFAAATVAAATARQQPATIPESPPMTEVYTSSDADIEEDSAYDDQTGSWKALDTDYSRTTPPASPPRHFVTRANAATPYVPNFGSEELARVVPLPPDVIETLRVSVACFPETILLSSSLTIETIRSYSKKMRHPETDMLRLASTLVPDDESTGKRSLWSKVNPLKKSSSSSLRHSAMRSINGSRAGSISGGNADSQKAWSAIQNVFGTCSEYICDALFAHIMAYNYISALLARSAASTPATTATAAANLLGRHTSCRSRPSVDQKRGDDIPRKAASLLGLGDMDPPGSSSGGGGRFARRTSTVASTIASRPWSRDGLLPGQPNPSVAGSGGDAAVRTVHAGLYKCIVRLIATARLTSVSERLDEPIVSEDTTEVDTLFMRSICEIVRLVEETS